MIGICGHCGDKLEYEIIDLCDKCKTELAHQWFTKQHENNNSVIESRQKMKLYYAMTEGLYQSDYL